MFHKLNRLCRIDLWLQLNNEIIKMRMSPVKTRCSAYLVEICKKKKIVLWYFHSVDSWMQSTVMSNLY